MFLALCEGRVEWNSNSTLFEGFVHVDWGTGTIKECCGDSWLPWLERTEDCLGDNLASVLRRMLRKRLLKCTGIVGKQQFAQAGVKLAQRHFITLFHHSSC